MQSPDYNAAFFKAREKEFNCLRKSLDVEIIRFKHHALEKRVGAAVSCEIEVPSKVKDVMMGGMHLHVPIRFFPYPIFGRC